MRFNTIFRMVILIFFATAAHAGEVSSPPAREVTGSEQKIIAGIEKRYAAIGFSARFHQFSTLKAMEIVDTASGSIIVKRPGMMRWTYEAPEKQTIVSDGRQLWVYRPQDNQVMVGKTPAFFGNGKGAGFLADLTSLKKQFDISREKDTPEGDYRLTLAPKEKTQEISAIHLIVAKETFTITEIITVNIYGDETRIQFSDIQFQEKIDNTVFSFDIPDGVDVIHLDQ
ncbi:MAG: outer membrane lipoprotein carrier protein LolA [Deltaproteobacteria bacterium]|nr:MAG: outer membrane lipoprotein carrier protein LolA [Deltaproteobacteria bacterium]